MFHSLSQDKLVLRPVWDWGEQFADKDLLMFANPLYRRPAVDVSNRQSLAVVLPSTAIRLPGLANNRMTLNLSPTAGGVFTGASPVRGTAAAAATLRSQVAGGSGGGTRFLEPVCRISELGIWQQCYYRWLPILDLHNGGAPQADLYHRILIGHVAKMQQALQTGDYDDLPTPTSTAAGTNLPAVNAFYPFGSTSATDEGAIGLGELLALGGDALTEGSIFDGLSMSQGPD